MGTNRQSMFVGDKFQTSNGVVEVVDYFNAFKVTVMFDDGHKTVTSAGHIREGTVGHPYRKVVYGIGYVGIGIYKATQGTSDYKVYQIWSAMLQRCYDKKHQEKINPTYDGCSVSEDWHCYQKYAEDYYNLVGESKGWHIDKDIIIRGNKVYSYENCCAVPPELNMMLCGGNAARGKFPIGVSWNKRRGMFRSYSWGGIGKQIHLGYYNDVQSAFNAYKVFKESFIKGQANKWRDQIDPRAYQALLNYEVHVDD